MTDNLIKAKTRLEENDCTFVLYKPDKFIVSSEHGIKPLLNLLDSDEDVRDAYAADKIVGKAAAFLHILLQTKEIYAEVMSKTALEIFSSANIPAYYGKLTDYVVNRTGTGKCPMELAVENCSDPQSAYIALKEKVRELSSAAPLQENDRR